MGAEGVGSAPSFECHKKRQCQWPPRVVLRHREADGLHTRLRAGRHLCSGRWGLQGTFLVRSDPFPY